MATRAGNEKQDRTRESAHGVVVPADRGDGRDTLSTRICRDHRPHAPRRRAVGRDVRYFDRAERRHWPVRRFPPGPCRGDRGQAPISQRWPDQSRRITVAVIPPFAVSLVYLTTDAMPSFSEST